MKKIIESDIISGKIGNERSKIDASTGGTKESSTEKQ